MRAAAPPAGQRHRPACRDSNLGTTGRGFLLREGTARAEEMDGWTDGWQAGAEAAERGAAAPPRGRGPGAPLRGHPASARLLAPPPPE